jgi:hypothetical protein
LEVAKLILGLIKALAWPLVTVILVLRFQSVLTETFRGLNERLRTAESLKFGVVGQQIELSGTAKELLKRSADLVESGESAEAQRAQESAQRLRNPIADLVGVALFHAAAKGLTIEEIVQTLLASFGTQSSQTPLTILALKDEVDKILNAMADGKLAERHDDRFVLTRSGLEVFKALEQQQTTFLKHFQQLATPAPTPR